MYFSDFLHQLSKTHAEGRGPIPQDPSEWPEEWRTIFYKTYPHLPHIELDRDAEKELGGLVQAISARQSGRLFAGAPLSSAQIGMLLRYSCGLQGAKEQVNDPYNSLTAEQHRAQPSGGGRFPIETYVFNFRSGEIPSGIFHYDVRNHQLDVLEKRAFSETDIEELFYYPFVQEASCAVVLTAVFRRSQAKYGERGYRYILLEAGHIGQNISLVSNALGIRSVMMGGSNDRMIEHALDIDGNTESLVYSAIIGA